MRITSKATRISNTARKRERERERERSSRRTVKASSARTRLIKVLKPKDYRERKSGIELLRILAMLAIVAHHVALHTQWLEMDYTNFILVGWFRSFGKVAVLIFFMITGWFACKKTKFQTVPQVLKVARPVWIYMLLAIIFALLFIPKSLDSIGWKAAFPLVTGQYWFASSYIALILFLPLIVKILNRFEDSTVLVTTLTLVCAMTVFWLLWMSDKVSLHTNADLFISFCGMLIGYTLKLYAPKIKTGLVILIYITSLFIVGGSYIWWLALLESGTNIILLAMISAYSPFIIALAASSLLLFSRMKIKSHKINYLASLTFGVYLIHDNPIIQGFLFRNGDRFGLIASSQTEDALAFALRMAIVVIAIYAVCSTIEAARLGIERKIYRE